MFKYNILRTNKKQLTYHQKLKIEKAYNCRNYKNYFVSHGASTAQAHVA